jgi:Ni/Co efflux regulator RcnB
MKRLLLTTSIAALLLSSATVSAAGGHDKHGKHDRDDRNGHYDRGHDRGHDYDRDRDRRHDNGHHLGQIKQRYRRGERAPVVYLQPRYYVQDYRAYHLAPPPRGYRWVRPENDRYLLVEAASGLISQVLGY